MNHTESGELVLRDLVDTLLQENVFGVADALAVVGAPPEPGAGLAAHERWCRIELASGGLVFRGRDGGALQRHRFSRGPVWHDGPAGVSLMLAPSELLTTVAAGRALTGARVGEVAADLRAAVDHAAVTLAGRVPSGDRAPRPGAMLAGERLAATRNRPFHPTARAAAGWSAAELEKYGPMRRGVLGVDWVAVRGDRLRYGSDARSVRMEHLLLNDLELELLADAQRRADAPSDEYRPLPVHPWQFEHVLPREYAGELESRAVVPLTRGLGRFHPTSSLRTLTTSPETEVHLKLPLGVATLGAARLLPPRYLDNGERAQHSMQRLLERDRALGALVRLCDERAWCGWRCPEDDDEFTDRPGHLAAQVRTYPAGLLDDPDGLVLPMAALAAHEWPVLWPAVTAAGFDRDDPIALFGTIAQAFCRMAFAFLRYGVLPELHGQNVVIVLRRGEVDRFVLRDHDTLRLHPDGMLAAEVPDPGYRIKPGARQSLSLATAGDLLGYLQTLGLQVNLYGIADALARHHDIDERVFWERLRSAVTAALDELELPATVAGLLDQELLRSTEWPSRQVLEPLLRQGRSSGVSMPAGAGRVPNPLLPVPAAVR